ncbi:hypothetical protein LTR37_014625 [Vermiconidia calcicola]|uniref:Uncharacterized protein n=1 Tax=Vermiconidia calcicola TaxID=1690605 RepID=A0ACC3MT15_9PEZI|nr:hypothetical protein LTR37_014625 [Vermiconidia calcicola]
MVETKDIRPSEGEDPATLAQETIELVDNGRWQLCNSGKGLERQFKFKTFKATWDFMNTVAAECKTQKHHPEWTNVYNKTHIQWTTHNPEGLSSRDTRMARFCDEVGTEKGELPAESGDVKVTKGEMVAGDCCKKG